MMDVRLPDGTVIQNVPDGMSKADLMAKLKANGYDVSKLEMPQQAPPTPSAPPATKGAFERNNPITYKIISTTRDVLGPTAQALGATGGAIGGAAAALLAQGLWVLRLAALLARAWVMAL